MINLQYLEKLEEYMRSGNFAEDFKWSSEERRLEMIEFLEKFMDLADLADKVATAVIFNGSPLQAFLPQDAENK